MSLPLSSTTVIHVAVLGAFTGVLSLLANEAYTCSLPVPLGYAMQRQLPSLARKPYTQAQPTYVHFPSSEATPTPSTSLPLNLLAPRPVL